MELAVAVDPTARILESAETCFRELGYDGASVRAIAASAGVSKSLVLYHFHSKERLYAQVQVRIYDRLARSIREAAAQHGGSAVDRGLVALDALIEALRDRNDLTAHAMMGARALSSPKLREQVEHLRSNLRQLLQDTMHDVLGDAPLPVSMEAAADLLWAVFIGVGLESAFEDDPNRVDRALCALRTFMAIGLEKTTGSS